MSNETFWAIRRRELAKHAAPEPEKPKKAKKVKEAPVEEPIVLTEADSLADLSGEPRPDNPTASEEAPVAEVEAEPAGEQEAAPVQAEAEEVAAE